MKKKGPRDIPDFSRKPRTPIGKVTDAGKGAATPKPREPMVKPPTSAPKGGQRGR